MFDAPAPLDQSAHAEARARQASLTKPAGALGRLEDLACWFAARQRRAVPGKLSPAITVFAADHGVAARAVSAYPAEVTMQMVANFRAGGAAINVLAREIGASLAVVDAGVGRPTGDLASGPAMTPDEVARALRLGRDAADADIARGATLLIAGDMGIGNTTSAACLVCALADARSDEAVGLGTGIGEAALARKRAAVSAALSRIGDDPARRPLQVLEQAGGHEIVAIAGYAQRAAARGVPLLLDGFIATAAALAAEALSPGSRDWMLSSHRSAERGHSLALARLGLEPLLDLGLRLGEGSGAALAVPLLQAAIALHAGMATFTQAGVSGQAGRA